MNLRFTLIFLLLLGCFVNLASTTTRRSLLGRARDFLSKIASKLNKFIANPRETIFDIVSGFTDNLTRSLSQVRHCYDATFGFHKLNIFNASLSFSSIALSFYEAFPNKTISRKSLRELKNSIQEIIGQCLTTPRRLTARYGFTEFSDWTPKEMKMLMGLKHPKKTAKRRHHHTKRSISYCELDETAPLPFRFDWRDFDKVTPVRHQGRCGSCWTFAVNAALESGWLIKRRLMASNTSIDLSEQHLLNCALGEMGEPRGTGCSGASSDIAFRFTLKKGSVYEGHVPYTGHEGHCNSSIVTRNTYLRDYCTRGGNFLNVNPLFESTLSDETIMRALVQKGPLFFSINAHTIRHYRSGVIDDDHCGPNTNHAVLLVGYDGADNSWILKNSWGTHWGDGGYLKVVRGKNMCGVNAEIAWPIIMDSYP